MTSFTYYAPTKVVFGKGMEQRTGRLVAEQGCKKALLHYGGGSVKKNGVLDKVTASLKEAGVEYVELGGVVPNPHLGLVYEGIELCRREGVDFILAVGGGSVIDSAKAIAYGVPADFDVWDLYEGKQQVKTALPVGAVVTIAAAGSEMSNSSVISNEKTGMKKGYSSNLGRCKFAVLNPEFTCTLPAEQTAAGCADILMHTMERYFTTEKTMQMTDGIAEALMKTVMENARILTRQPNNYEARAEVMWAGSLSHNGLTEAGGGRGDWACHQMSHALSAQYGATHGAALTALWSSWARYVYKQDVERFATFAERVMELPHQKDEQALALAGIEEMEGFFWALDLPTSLAEAEIFPSEEDIAQLAQQITYFGQRTVGAVKVLGEKEIADILRLAKGDD